MPHNNQHSQNDVYQDDHRLKDELSGHLVCHQIADQQVRQQTDNNLPGAEVAPLLETVKVAAMLSSCVTVKARMPMMCTLPN